MGRQLCWNVPNSGTRLILISGVAMISLLIIALEELTFAPTECSECEVSLKERTNDVSKVTSISQLRSLLPQHDVELQLQDGQSVRPRNSQLSEVRSSSQLRCENDDADDLGCSRENGIWQGKHEELFSDTEKEPEVHEEFVSDTEKEPHVHEEIVNGTEKEPEVHEEIVSDTEKEPEVHEEIVTDTEKEPEVHEEIVNGTEKEPVVHEEVVSYIEKEPKVDGESEPLQLKSPPQHETSDESTPARSDDRLPDAQTEDSRPRLNGNSRQTALNSDVKEPNIKDHDDNGLPPPPPWVPSVYFYTQTYKHPKAKLRLLAPRIRSTAPLRDRTITVVTQTSPDRLAALERLCMTWSGALCIAVHVRLESQYAEVFKQLTEMRNRLEHGGRCWLDIQMATEDGFESDAEALAALYPVNALRNVALALASTDLIFLLDADFQPILGLHEKLTENEATYLDLLRKATQKRQLFVVAAFEAASSQSVPETMEDLKAGWEEGSLTYFHSRQSPYSHMPTNFTRFFDPATESPYPITFREGFEPYVIGARNVIPPYDARFRGYGGNKESHLYLCAARGMGFQVLPNAFVFELPHPPSEARISYAGRNKVVDQRRRIIGLYSQFKKKVEREQLQENPARFKRFLRDLRPPS